MRIAFIVALVTLSGCAAQVPFTRAKTPEEIAANQELKAQRQRAEMFEDCMEDMMPSLLGFTAATAKQRQDAAIICKDVAQGK